MGLIKFLPLPKGEGRGEGEQGKIEIQLATIDWQPASQSRRTHEGFYKA